MRKVKSCRHILSLWQLRSKSPKPSFREDAGPLGTASALEVQWWTPEPPDFCTACKCRPNLGESLADAQAFTMLGFRGEGFRV